MEVCTQLSKEKFAGEFKKIAEISESKALDFLPEKQTILVITGLLASIGITLSFNIAAILAFTLGIGLFYVFFNIGSLFYLFGKTRDTIWPATMLLIAFVAAYSTIIIPIIIREML